MAGQEPVSTPRLRSLNPHSTEELELTKRPLEVVLHLGEALAEIDWDDFGPRALAALGECLRLPDALLFACMDAAGPTLAAAAGVEPARLGGPAILDRLARLAAQGSGLELQSVGFHPRLDADLKSALQASGYQAIMEIPLRHRQRQTGALLLLLSAPRVLSVRQSETLLAVGRLLGTALAAADRLKARDAARAAAEAARAQAEENLSYTEERYRQLGISDNLTGLYNSRHFHGILEAEVERSRRFGDGLGLMLLDVDDLKQFNETHGRDAGDQVLARLGRILRWSVRKIDRGFRYGGEEFAVILPHCDLEALSKLAERVREGFAAEKIEVADGSEQLTVSIGAALYRRAMPLESFIRCADRALYEAKTQGKNQVVLGGPCGNP